MTNRWAAFTARELDVIHDGLLDVANTDDPDEEIQEWKTDALSLIDDMSQAVGEGPRT